ncbi:MAG: glycosyltransferase [Lachnospiraceae bacterium]|nr:glycosyltransferase [Lachnospiraceae bacterium]
MKILMVNKFLHPNGGSETYIFELGKQLTDMGHEVQYFGMEHKGRIVGNRVDSYTADMDFHTGKLQKLFYPFKIIYSVEARKKIRAVLQDFQPDVVHLNNINFQLTPAIIYEIRAFEKMQARQNAQSSNRRAIKIIYTAHDYQWVCPNHMMMIPSNEKLCFACKGGKFGACTKNRCIHDSLIKSILGSIEAFYYKWRKTYALVDVIICPSEFMKKQLDTNPILAEKTVVMHNFITEMSRDEKLRLNDKTETVGETEADSEAAESWTRLNAKLPDKYALYFGRFSTEKGVETLLNACRKTSQINYVFAGTGPLEKELAKLPNVTNVGFVRGIALQKLIAQSQFSLYPSQWYENCPFSVMESQIYGTPVIAANIGGIPELIEDGVTGELFKPGDQSQLEEKIIRLWNQPKLCSKYSENCKNIKFDTTEEYCGKIISDIYRKQV